MRLRLVLMCLLFSRFALADSVPPMPPMTCDPGARWGVDHGGGSCNPTYCQASDQCEKGQACQMQGLCISFALKTGRPGNLYVETNSHGKCDAKNACSFGACEVVKRCAPKGSKATSGPENALAVPTVEQLLPKPAKTPEPKPEPKTPETQPEPPESQPDEAPDSTPTKVTPPTKVDKGRCGVSPASELDDSFGLLLLAFSLVLIRRRR